eukprot:CAMPEP_0114139246 /NCGR_PEP_ID=MMETSP0043_2-20121206/16753_1 /TAXON_ID=464988 /ORGANISM="Hemiselmis andersenii, Strain CCMP644" /LENGTH=91 /DNA_ID=CAMNT_0001233269 /DNA_START=167 /DNA_END=442 /DNA_ORIENTATION=+
MQTATQKTSSSSSRWAKSLLHTQARAPSRPIVHGHLAASADSARLIDRFSSSAGFAPASERDQGALSRARSIPVLWGFRSARMEADARSSL